MKMAPRYALLVRQGFHTRQLFAFEELEAGAAAGGDVGDLVGYSGLVDRAHRIAAADDGDGRPVGCDRMRNGVGAHGEFGKLEDAGGAVPDDGARGRYNLLDSRDGLGADVQTLPFRREVDRRVPQLRFGIGSEVVGEDVVD